MMPSSTSAKSRRAACARCARTSASATICKKIDVARWPPSTSETRATPSRSTALTGRAADLSAPATRSSNREFFLARVEQARAELAEATLEHVRERCRRSEAAWQGLADKAERSERLRDQEAKRKAEAGLTS